MRKARERLMPRRPVSRGSVGRKPVQKGEGPQEKQWENSQLLVKCTGTKKNARVMEGGW